MDMKDILRDMLDDLERAKADMATAKELVTMGEEMQIDVGKNRAEIRDLEMKIARYESVINKRLKKQE